MSVGGLHRVGAAGGRSASAPSRALAPGDVAWAALLPCALVVAGAILLLGPPLGGALPRSRVDYWDALVDSPFMRPEPTERARYVLALLGPVLLGGVTFACARLRPSAGAGAVTLLARAGRVALAVGLLAAVAAQRRLTYGVAYEAPAPFRTVYFTVPTLVAAIVVAVMLALALRSDALVARVRPVLRESRAKRLAAFAAGALFVALWLLTAFNTDTSILSVHHEVWDNLPFWADEAFALLNGRAPLVDFHAQYAQLWSYLVAGALALFGTTLSVYTSVMIAGTLATMLAVLDAFRRLVGSSLLALALFLPFVATSFFMEGGPPANRYGPSNLFSFFPVRYGGAYVLFWLVVRRLERRPASPPVLLFTFAGLVAINNPEFGLPALAATLAALLAAERPRTPARVARLLGSVVAGLAAAAAAVAALTLAVAGAWPSFAMAGTFSRIFSEGFGMLPMPAVGFHLVLYATFAAAIVTAVVRLLEPAEDRRLSVALMWTGMFGLGAGVYFAGRSHPHVLVDLFSAWTLALALLAVVAARGILERPGRGAGLPEVLVFACLGLAVCSLAQTPTPWGQWQRIADARPGAGPIERYMVTQRAAVEAATSSGEPVALLMREGHRIAHDVGVVDVLPYANIDSMPTRSQWVEMVQALRRSGGTRILAPTAELVIERADWLIAAGFEVGRTYPQARLLEFTSRPGG